MNFVSDNVPAPYKISSPFAVSHTSPLFFNQQPMGIIQPKSRLRNSQSRMISSHDMSNTVLSGIGLNCNHADDLVQIKPPQQASSPQISSRRKKRPNSNSNSTGKGDKFLNSKRNSSSSAKRLPLTAHNFGGSSGVS